MEQTSSPPNLSSSPPAAEGVHFKSQPIINWSDLTHIANRISTAFKSLNAEIFQTGLVLFDKENFKFERRCNWTNSHIIASIATRGDKRATFESCHAGFYEINNLALLICQTVAKYIPQSDNLKEPRDFLYLLTNLQTIIDSVTKPGLEQLRLNYISVSKLKQAASIQALGASSMIQISKSWKKLESSLNDHIPNLQTDLALERFMLQAKSLLSDRNTKVAHLRKVEWKPDLGVLIPQELIVDCLRDQALALECTKAILRNAVCLLRLPTFAAEIPTLSGSTSWKPVRLTHTSEFCVVAEAGVGGTCERNNLPSDNLCNFYYRNGPTLVMSCGANWTTRQTQQLAFAMKSIFEQHPQNNSRVAAFQLNSFFKEAYLVNGVHSNTALNEEYFEEELNIPKLSFLHFNACFNAATVVKNEDPQSLKGINIDGLARMAGFVLMDIKQLLKENKDFLIHLGSIEFEIQQAEFISSDIISLKKTIQSLDGNEHHRDKMTLSTHMAKERKSPDPVVQSGIGSINDDDPLSHVEFTFIESPSNSKKKDLQLCKTSLAGKQEELITQLKLLPPLINNIISQIENAKQGQPNSKNIEKSLQLLKALEQLLALQLKLPEYPTLSRSTEIELFFFLFKGLNIIPLIMCYSGLDRSGQARAMYESLLQIEENIYQTLLNRKAEKNEEEQTGCRIEARNKILHLILNADRYRKEIFSILNSLPQPTYIDDLSIWEKGTKGTDIRERLIGAIDQKYLPPSSESEYLKYMLEYSECILKQLLATEMEKTQNSTGALGLKYGLDGQGLKSYFANFHVLDRWPPFIFVGVGAEKRAIKIIEYYEGWLSTTNKTTQAANSLILRLSKLRGN